MHLEPYWVPLKPQPISFLSGPHAKSFQGFYGLDGYSRMERGKIIGISCDEVPNMRVHSKKKSACKHLFLVLQLVTNRELCSVPGKTKWYLEASWQAYWGPQGQEICLSWCFQIPFGPSRYWIESSICDNLKYQKRCSEVLFLLECSFIECGFEHKFFIFAMKATVMAYRHACWL